MPALQITTREDDDGVVLVLDGEIDMASEEQFHRVVRDTLDSVSTRRVVLDCTRLRFVDSSGLRVLIQSHRSARERGVALFIASVTERLTQILRVTGIDTRITIFPTVEAALAAPLETPSAN
ncbi:anti-sigma B factor antagonist [Lipingzhangella halophila]|uniref:Anti-sigma factor antagonist n=1 Tax=Lipingzhangella halophila TaxID=1783352 RepID=A0A7W7RCJ7_9ACTN|nr:STAS domain-containing protein [Lipingzhangella halophila]MBB4929493.1 anti-sigma B factor antagonist [Lipingzhangella halophila]